MTSSFMDDHRQQIRTTRFVKLAANSGDENVAFVERSRNRGFREREWIINFSLPFQNVFELSKLKRNSPEEPIKQFRP